MLLLIIMSVTNSCPAPVIVTKVFVTVVKRLCSGISCRWLFADAGGTVRVLGTVDMSLLSLYLLQWHVCSRYAFC